VTRTISYNRLGARLVARRNLERTKKGKGKEKPKQSGHNEKTLRLPYARKKRN